MHMDTFWGVWKGHGEAEGKSGEGCPGSITMNLILIKMLGFYFLYYFKKYQTPHAHTCTLTHSNFVFVSL